MARHRPESVNVTNDDTPHQTLQRHHKNHNNNNNSVSISLGGDNGSYIWTMQSADCYGSGRCRIFPLRAQQYTYTCVQECAWEWTFLWTEWNRQKNRLRSL